MNKLVPETLVRDVDGSPAVPYLEMLLQADGTPTVRQAWMEGFRKQSVSGDSTPIWMREFPGTPTKVWFNILPVGWIGEWHTSPALQWVVPISGRWFIETQDGTRVEMGPGEIHWGADVANATTGRDSGHRSGQLGDVPCVQLMVQFAQPE